MLPFLDIQSLQERPPKRIIRNRLDPFQPCQKNSCHGLGSLTSTQHETSLIEWYHSYFRQWKTVRVVLIKDLVSIQQLAVLRFRHKSLVIDTIFFCKSVSVVTSPRWWWCERERREGGCRLCRVTRCFNKRWCLILTTCILTISRIVSDDPVPDYVELDEGKGKTSPVRKV